METGFYCSEYLSREFCGFSLEEILSRSQLMEQLKAQQRANIQIGISIQLPKFILITIKEEVT
jgi:hypothetical protein